MIPSGRISFEPGYAAWMLHKGYTYFVTDPASNEVKHCRICGTRCEVEVYSHGATSFASAVKREYGYHDKHTCPHAEEAWHVEALDLFQELEGTKSKRVRALIRADLDELVGEHLDGEGRG